jgi:hypothetical protein
MAIKQEVTIAGTDTARLVALEECEQKIFSAYRRGLEATCALAREFNKIERQELYRERGCESFEAYAQEYLRLDLRSVERTRAVARVIQVLQEAGLRPPANETQAAELARLEESKQPHIWQILLSAEESTDKPLTVSAVRKAVDNAAGLKDQAPSPARGVQTALDMESGGPSTGTQATTEQAPKKMTPLAGAKLPERISLSELGEAALERIKRLCGKAVASAVESGNLPISERDLRKWADEEDTMVERLAHYINDLRWTVSKAIAFENADIDEGTSLQKLREMTIARQGRMRFELDDMKVSIELV